MFSDKWRDFWLRIANPLPVGNRSHIALEGFPLFQIGFNFLALPPNRVEGPLHHERQLVLQMCRAGL